MAVTLLMYRHGSTLVPADQLAAEDLAKLSATKAIMVEAKQPRSLPQHRLLFALLRKVVENMDASVTEHALLSWLKVELGHVETMPLGFGKSYRAPASIAFAQMSQADFQAFFNGAVDLICGTIIPGMDKPALLAEVQAMVAQGEA